MVDRAFESSLFVRSILLYATGPGIICSEMNVDKSMGEAEVRHRCTNEKRMRVTGQEALLE